MTTISTSTEEQTRVGTIEYTYELGAIHCRMFGYVDDDAGEPTWYWRWTRSDPAAVGYMLKKYPELVTEKRVVIY